MFSTVGCVSAASCPPSLPRLGEDDGEGAASVAAEATPRAVCESVQLQYGGGSGGGVGEVWEF